ncbi:type III secretion system translocon protein [Salmonella enterica subsp. salamae]|nr:type III secretion system translocon protein [Salmonella enterica subsp. salamae]ECJ2280083.1 type III secretion system translocon protein [Salmonella enterica subsp. salamae]HCC0886910.1 type III secretion system translocon protein [Salmonella enterica]
MNRIDSNSNSAAGVNALSHHHLGNVICVSSGALGKRHQRVEFASDHSKAALATGQISLQEANNALRVLLDAIPGNHQSPSLPDFFQMNPTVLSMMITNLVLNVFGSSAQSLCQQLERATEVQNVLRDKRVKEYQEQVQKAIEDENKARKAGIFGAIFDWIIGIFETVLGALKVAEGFLTGNPAEMASGVAYMAAGVAGLVKAGAETAMLLGADPDTCKAIINIAGKVQFGCEMVGALLDVFQIGRAFLSARGVLGSAEKVLSEVGEEMAERVGGACEADLESLSEEFGEAVSDDFTKQFESVEREMVEPEEMAEETGNFSNEAEKNMTRSAGKSFTKAGVKAIAKAAAKEALEKFAQKGGEFVFAEFRKQLLTNLLKKIISALVKDCLFSFKALQAVRFTAEGCNQLNSGVIGVEKAKLEKKIAQLMADQRFLDFIVDQTEAQKKMERKRLQALYKGSGTAVKDTLDTIDAYSSVQARMAGGRA